MHLSTLLLQTLLTLTLTTASPSPRSLHPRADMCYFDSGPVGSGNAICAGSGSGNKNGWTDVLTCPDQGVADRICGRDDVSATARDNCKRIDGTASYCTVGGPLPKGGHHFCYCVNGNFCCTLGAEVPGGDSPVNYFKQQGCSCGSEK